MADKYEVLYSRVTFAGSPCEKGIVISTPENGWIWLKDRRKETIEKGQVPASKIKQMKSGQITYLGLYKVLLERIIREREREPSKVPSSSMTQTFVDKENQIKDSAALNQSKNIDSVSTVEGVPIDKEFNKKPTLDEALVSKMHKHQVEAAKFVLSRLLGEEPDIIDTRVQNIRGQSADDEKMRSNNPYASSDLPVTGCILADEMGLGKSLSALCVMWSFVRHGRGKGVIVCPSSLVGNWNQEIKKWLSGLHSKTIFVKSSQKDKQVYEFIKGHSSTHPLLVISYENFRSVAVHLNKIQTWETIICDEGHRLKNAELTQTSLALGNCVAQRRLVLTGTPIQNNLDELYSVINFVCPGYFGTLEDFTSNFTTPITLQNGESRFEATKILKQQLKRILLRRIRDEVLSAMLPPRKSFTVYCPLTESQKEKYMMQAERLLEGLKINAKDSQAQPTKKQSKSVRALKNSLTLDSSDESESDGEPSGEGSAEDGLHRYEKCKQESENFLKKPSKRKRTTTHGESKMKESQVLPALMELRLISDTSTTFNRANSYSDEAGEELTKPSVQVSTTSDNKELRQTEARSAIERSGKIAALDALLSAVRDVSGDSEKAVVVSNFQNVLDEVEVLARGRGWHFLRIDGDVPAERRMKLVSHFNNPASPFFLMLLSARAGGVGLNLIGGSRLILVDPDWNPATDQQAAGRIWRDGQTKPVFIYRFISAGSIDETILSRQQTKGALNAVISVEGEVMQAEDDSNCGSSKRVGKGDISAMIFPRGKEYLSEQPNLSIDGCEADPVLQKLVSLRLGVSSRVE